MAGPQLRDWIPEQNFRDDAEAGGALAAFINDVLQPVLDLAWEDAENFGRQIDPDLANANTVGAMLLDLGCPFPTALALPIQQQRALVKALVRAYKQFGTAPALIDMVRALTGVEITAVISPAIIDGWILDESYLGDVPNDDYDAAVPNMTVLAGSTGNDFSFQVQVTTATLAAMSFETRRLIREIIRRLKPAHTHFYGFVTI